MKKIFYLLLLPIALATFTACTSTVDDVFDQPTATRVEQAITDSKNVLMAPENGWIMKYYADPQYGGYYILCKFNKDSTVTVESEAAGAVAYTSHYSVGQSQGIVLSFDEDNPAFHYFSDPANPDGYGDNGKGMEGDFEFRVLKATPDSVVLVGKKHGSEVVMTPAPADMNWNTYTTQLINMDKAMAANSYFLVVGNDTITATPFSRSLSFTDPESNSVITMTYIQTTTGYELTEPITFMGKTITGFTYSDDDVWLNPADETVKLLPIVYEPYAEGLFYSNIFEAMWPQTLLYSKVLDTYLFEDLYAFGYDYYFKVSSDGSLTQVPNAPVKTGVSDATYGPLYILANPAKSVFDGMVFDFYSELTVAAGSFDFYDELFLIQKQY